MSNKATIMVEKLKVIELCEFAIDKIDETRKIGVENALNTLIEKSSKPSFWRKCFSWMGVSQNPTPLTRDEALAILKSSSSWDYSEYSKIMLEDNFLYKTAQKMLCTAKMSRYLEFSINEEWAENLDVFEKAKKENQ